MGVVGVVVVGGWGGSLQGKGKNEKGEKEGKRASETKKKLRPAMNSLSAPRPLEGKKKTRNSRTRKKKNAPHDLPLALPLNHDSSHCVQCVSWCQETGACPSKAGSRPRNLRGEGARYHAAKMPTVALPT